MFRNISIGNVAWYFVSMTGNAIVKSYTKDKSAWFFISLGFFTGTLALTFYLGIRGLQAIKKHRDAIWRYTTRYQEPRAKSSVAMDIWNSFRGGRNEEVDIEVGSSLHEPLMALEGRGSSVD